MGRPRILTAIARSKEENKDRKPKPNTVNTTLSRSRRYGKGGKLKTKC